MDTADRPHVAYVRANGTYFGIVVYGWKEGPDWRTERAVVGESVTGSISLSLDPQDQPHIAYASNFRVLRYGRRVSAGQWSLVTVADEEPPFRLDTAALAIGTDNVPQIAYGRTYSGLPVHHEDVIYTRLVGSRWWRTIVEIGGIGAGQSLALDAQNRPHLLYCLADPTDAYSLRYARLRGQLSSGLWATNTIESSLERLLVHGGGAIQVDATGAVHVGYSSQIAGSWAESEIRYGYSSDGKAWSLSTVETVAEHRRMGARTTLALNPLDEPALTYNDMSLGLFKYAH